MNNMAQKNDKKKPGEAALQNMQLLKNESTLFKVPKVPPKKKIVKKTEILDEEEYVEVKSNNLKQIFIFAK